MRQRQEVQEVLPPLRIFPARPTESAVRKLPYGPARSAATQIHGPHDAYDANQDLLEGGRDVVALLRFESLTVPCKTAQQREHARVLPLAREVEKEEDCPRSLVRPIRTAGEALQHAEQFRGDFIPVVERPLHGLAGQ